MKEKGKAKNLGVVKPSSINHYIKVTKESPQLPTFSKNFGKNAMLRSEFH